MTKLTDFQRRLLTLIRDHPGITANRLSELLWPDSDAHKKQYRSGQKGVAAGKGAWLSAGSHAAKLRKKGWVEDALMEVIRRDRHGNEVISHELSGYKLTEKGLEVLETIEVYLTKDEKEILAFMASNSRAKLDELNKEDWKDYTVILDSIWEKLGL